MSDRLKESRLATKAERLTGQPHTNATTHDAEATQDGQLPAKEVAMAIAQAGLGKKAEEVEVINVTGKVDYADFVVVMSGRSDRQVSAIARGVEEALRTQGIRCLGMEGIPQGAWVLMDYADVIVHVFHEGVRGYYDLESLWLDAERIHVTDEPEGA